MFDFFKYAYVELNKLDTEKIKEIEENKKKENENSRVNKKTKLVITVIGVIYLIMATLNIYNIVMTKVEFKILKYIFLIILDIFILITIRMKEKEKLGIVGIILFIAINFIATNI